MFSWVISNEFKAVRQAYSWRSQRQQKRGNDGGKERASNVKTCTLLLNNSANGPVVVNHGWERNKPQLHHTRIGLHGCSQNPARGKLCTLITTMAAPWWDSTTDFSPRYHKKNQKVYLKLEIKLKLTVKTCCRLGYKGNSQPFDTVIWFINHIIVTLLYMCDYVEIEHPIKIMHKLNFFFIVDLLSVRRIK